MITADDGSVMILIPEGSFPMGGREEEVRGAPDGHLPAYAAERPVHQVQEVTNKGPRICFRCAMDP